MAQSFRIALLASAASTVVATGVLFSPIAPNIAITAIAYGAAGWSRLIFPSPRQQRRRMQAAAG